MKILKILISIVLIVIFNFTVSATTFYVSVNTGNNSYNGLFQTFTCCNNGPKQTIQAAINAASATDTIRIAIGLYNELLTIDKRLMISGTSSGTNPAMSTILQSTSTGSGTGITLNVGGFLVNQRMIIKNLRIKGFQYGATLNSHTTFENVVLTDNSQSAFIASNGNFEDIIMKSCEMYNNKIGIYILHSTNIVNWTVDDCIIENSESGISIFCDNPSTANVKNLTIINSLIRKCSRKGMYIEKLEDALIENTIFDSCGTDTSYSWNAGVDINLKYNNYNNIVFNNCKISNCGIGGSSTAGCGITIKGRDDGGTYGANPATLDSVFINGISFENCHHGFVTGEPGKDNLTPTNLKIQECRFANNAGFDINYHIKSNALAHNNWWGASTGVSSFDTSKNSIGEIHVITWLKNGNDQDSLTEGFQSDSIVTFNNNLDTLRKAINVTPEQWTLSIPTDNYGVACTINKSITLKPESFVNIRDLTIGSSGDVVIIDNDLYVEDSLKIMDEGKLMIIGVHAIELSIDGILQEDPGDIIQGKIRTARNLNGSPAIENFGGIGIEITADMTLPFPENNIILTRYTGEIAKITGNNVTRIYDLFAHTKCGWKATLKFAFDSTELTQVNNESGLTLYRSWNAGNNWNLNSGNVLVNDNIITLSGINSISSWWSAVDSIGIYEPPRISVNHTADDVKCNGWSDGEISLIVSGGAKPYTYSWSNGDTTSIIDSLAPGIYKVSITDSIGCSSTDSMIITEAYPIIISANVKNVMCFGDSSGSVHLNITGGTPPYKFLWSSGDTNSSIIDMLTDTLSIIVKDSANCISYDTFIIEEPNELELDVQVISHDHGSNDGMAVANASGGTQPYSYLWNDMQNQKTDTAHSLTAGTYVVRVTDINLCEISDSVAISLAESIEAIDDKPEIKIYPNPNSNGQFMLELSRVNLIGARLQIFNNNGKLLYSNSIDRFNIHQKFSYSTLSKGIYHLKIVSKNFKPVTKELIIY